MILVDPKNLASKVNECLEIVLECSAVEINLTVYVATPDHWLITTGGYILPETMFHVANPMIKYASLRKLKLNGICISEKLIKDIVGNCPNIRSLCLGNFRGLKKLDISKLDKLEAVEILASIELLRVEIDAPNLREFNFSCSSVDSPRTIINLISCYDLRKFYLHCSAITDELLHSLLSRFPLLEYLAISSCNMLQRVVRISAPCLTSLHFYDCNKIEVIEVDAPALTSFTNDAKSIPRSISSNTPSRVEIVRPLWDAGVDTS